MRELAGVDSVRPGLSGTTEQTEAKDEDGPWKGIASYEKPEKGVHPSDRAISAREAVALLKRSGIRAGQRDSSYEGLQVVEVPEKFVKKAQKILKQVSPDGALHTSSQMESALDLLKAAEVDSDNAKHARKLAGAIKTPANKGPKKLKGKALDKEIEKSYYKLGHGVQIDIMDIDKVFKMGQASYEKDGDIEAGLAAAIKQFRKN